MPTHSNDGRRAPDRDVDDRFGRDADRGRDVDRDDRSYAASDDDRFGRGGGGENRSFGHTDEHRRFGQAVGRVPAYGVGRGTGDGLNEQRAGELGRIGSWFDERLVGHRGKGPRNFVRSDERLREIVCEVLADDDRIDASQVEVEVHSGDVTLSGTVPDRRMKRLAEDVIEPLPGVQEVHNHIRGPALLGRTSGTRSGAAS